MAEGPGRYDDLATYVRRRTNAAGVIVIVVGGNKGNGFAVQTWNKTFPKQIPAVLRDVADQIEGDAATARS